MKYVIQKKEERILSFLLDDAGHAVEIHADDHSDGPKIGDIYIGMVQKVVPGISACFVEIVPGVNGYLPLDEIVEPIYTRKGPSSDIQPGDQLLIQVTRDAFGQKDLALTTRITLWGTYCILTLGGQGVSLSVKLSNEVRAHLREHVISSEEFARMQDRIGQCGIVLRTAASEHVGNEEIIRKELAALEAEMADIRLKAPYRTVFTPLKKQPPRWLTRLNRLPVEGVEEVVTDDATLYRDLKEYLANEISSKEQSAYARELYPGNEETGDDPDYREMAVRTEAAAERLKVRYYEDAQVSMEKLFSLEREIARALKKKVDLKCGGDLVIESTEALHVIDVNSGRYQSGKEKEDAVLKVNLEAAREAARQIRLRNLSGIILIDFINLANAKNAVRIIVELRQAVAKDPVYTHVVDMTKLGLVEVTRKKIEQPLAKSMDIQH